MLAFALIDLSRSETSGHRNKTVLITHCLIIFQLLMLLYNPNNHVPDPRSEKKGADFLSLVKKIPGEVYIPYHSAYGVLAGKKMVFNAAPFWGYNLHSPGKYRPEDLIKKIKEKYFAAIIIDGDGYSIKSGERFLEAKRLNFLGDELTKIIFENYEPAIGISYSNKKEFSTITGYLTRPDLVMKPKKVHEQTIK